MSGMRMESWERWVQERLLYRNTVSEGFFPREAERLALACREMADRFLAGGRLLAAGRGVYVTDAQHVAVEFVHPVIVGKRALPAVDLSPLLPEGFGALLQPEDMVIGFGPPEGDPEVAGVLKRARQRGAFCFALPGTATDGDGAGVYGVPPPDNNPFVHQEMLEILYHTLWETVHVFFEHRSGAEGSGAGGAGSLYPFLSVQGEAREQANAAVVEAVAASIVSKAQDTARLRAEVAETEAGTIARMIQTLAGCLERGGKLLLMGNGGSATDANDWALDMVLPPANWRPLPAVSLAMDPAILSALANDVGAEVLFLRQVIAHARPGDAVVAITTSGNSRNIVLALEEARKRELSTVALLGYDGGEVVRRGLADIAIVVRSDYVPRIQEVHASIYHIVREGLAVVTGDA
ncbi:MAG TPA: SIS domain-containing protein [Thermaerobacter sp.]